jgi:hypothetical protein
MATLISAIAATAMNYEVNPFQDVYVADSVGEEEFAKLFSSVPLQPAIHPVFNEGNVVLYGTQGCGKTMILRLLYPTTRIGFLEARETFPVPRALANFVSAGVNLTKSAICDVAQVTLGRGREFDVEQLPFYFADFFNWWILKDLFENIRTVAYHQHIFGKMVDLGCEEEFVYKLVRQDCWFGTLAGCRTLDDVEERANNRVALYRKWVSFNERHAGGPPTLRESKTAIGEPLSRTVWCLKNSGVLRKSVRVFVRVDQLEELNQLGPVTTAAQSRTKEVRLAFRHVLNRVFGNREGMVHYRIGTRRYGWEDPELLVVHGSGARLEHRRDYLLVDMDDALFRRREHVGGTKGGASALFSKFASDAYRRRLGWAFHLATLPPPDQLEKTFGPSPQPHERAEYYGRSKTQPVRFEQALAMDSPAHERAGWSAAWRRFLQRLYKAEPLEAVLAAAWGRQTGGGRSKIQHRAKPPPRNAPWKRKQWWRKERLMQAVLQLAARRQQRLWWWGFSDILALSGGNISVFLHICHRIWDHFLNVERLRPRAQRINPLAKSHGVIPKEIQALGIQSASRAWLEKLEERPAGDLRRRFVEALGNRLRSKLRDDRAMSYPGANGFSITRSELTEPVRPNRDIWEFIKAACGYGALYSREHTTKEKSGKSRLKFYLSPILSPHFQLPVAHQKEPAYWKMADLVLLAKQAELPFMFDLEIRENSQSKRTDIAEEEVLNVNQLRLF